jgi:rhodanese-related sulfurtransferase
MTAFGQVLDGREVVQLVREERAQLVEVLPREDYEVWHLRGAISVPLRELDEGACEVLDPARPVIVYCNDAL